MAAAQQNAMNDMQLARQLSMPAPAPSGGLPAPVGTQVLRRGSTASESPSEANTTITQAVAQAQGQQPRTIDASQPLTEQQELQALRLTISTWRELESEVSRLGQAIREKKKHQKVLEEMILRTMKKYNIGAVDLKGSGGRLIYRRQTTKVTLNPKTLVGLLATHMKSESAAADAIKFINENRAAKVRESILYEKD